jgi:hypothetical protein
MMLLRLTSDGSNHLAGFSAAFECFTSFATCSCDAGWAGDECGTFDPCVGVECHGYGACTAEKRPATDSDVQAVCSCSVAYSSNSCLVFDQCVGVECHGHGVCTAAKRPATDIDVQAVCNCIGNWAGDRCERDLCAATKCGENGRCVRGECACLPHLGGDALRG